jgi:hypothetical protein
VLGSIVKMHGKPGNGRPEKEIEVSITSAVSLPPADAGM